MGLQISLKHQERLKRIREWAIGLPDGAWTPGCPPQIEADFALKTESGAILAGHLDDWYPNQSPVLLNGKWEKIVAYILVDEQSYLGTH
jgi:hypothetical protein